MADLSPLTPEDEALIQKFVGLQTRDKAGPLLQIPAQAAATTN